MKKLLALLLIVCTLVCSVGCSDKTENSDKYVEGGMKIATTTGDFKAYTTDVKEIIDLLHQAGFRYIDLSLYTDKDMEPFFADNWEDYTKELKSYAEDKGMSFVMAHALGGNALQDKVSYDKIVKATKRSIEVCDILGIPNIVVHSGHQPNLTTEEFYEKNKAFYSEFFPLMEQTGVNVLIENSTSANISNCFFLTGKDMRDFLEYVNHPNLKACWDTGHANIENHQYDDIIALDDYLAGLHVTDNNGQKDEHLMPYQGTMNIDAIMCALKVIDYKGVFDFECENKVIPKPFKEIKI